MSQRSGRRPAGRTEPAVSKAKRQVGSYSPLSRSEGEGRSEGAFDQPRAAPTSRVVKATELEA